LEKRQDQLVQAQKLSSIGTFASGIAHQVNNPLNNISTSCQILLEECKGASSGLAAKMLKNIESETFRARDIVRGLLEFSRTQEFVKTTNSLKDIVEKSVRLVSSQVPTGIEIIQQVPAPLELEIDRQRFQEVLLNLLINSIHAIEPDSGTISIIAFEDRENNMIVISIEDTGKGIPEKIRNRVFDPFFTTKDVGLGTGLGLYIVYGIVKRHQGTIEVDNLLAGGTRFTISLPIT
jgi:signal transduction histidine kinase